MEIPKSAYSVFLFWNAFVFTIPILEAQTKKLNRLGSKISLYSHDKFISESFDSYKYDESAVLATPQMLKILMY
jgi:hypothetical protein